MKKLSFAVGDQFVWRPADGKTECGIVHKDDLVRRTMIRGEPSNSRIEGLFCLAGLLSGYSTCHFEGQWLSVGKAPPTVELFRDRKMPIIAVLSQVGDWDNYVLHYVRPGEGTHVWAPRFFKGDNELSWQQAFPTIETSYPYILWDEVGAAPEALAALVTMISGQELELVRAGVEWAKYQKKK